MLCRTLGAGRWRHPEEMNAEMPARWLSDWQAAYGLDPWDEERADLRMQRVVWATLQPHSKKKLRESTFRFNFVRAATSGGGPAAYRRKAEQRYGISKAAWERKEARFAQVLHASEM